VDEAQRRKYYYYLCPVLWQEACVLDSKRWVTEFKVQGGKRARIKERRRRIQRYKKVQNGMKNGKFLYIAGSTVPRAGCLRTWAWRGQQCPILKHLYVTLRSHIFTLFNKALCSIYSMLSTVLSILQIVAWSF
jgi:hypothetical protein